MRLKKITVVFLAAIVARCAVVPINQSTVGVRVTNVEPGKECKYLGDITGSQGDFFSGPWTSNENLETGARNDIKNKAAAMGGNVVSLLTQRAGITGSGGGGGYGGGSLEQTNVTLSGNVYRCPE